MLKTDKKSNLLKLTAIAIAVATIPLAGHAAGLGKVAVYSLLGQPLKAEIEVSANSEELSSLQAKLASVDAFRQADVEYTPVLSSLKFSREVIERNGHRYVQVTTDKPVNEPFISMLVELGWSSGRLVREYTFLLDPPDLAPATTAAPVSAPVTPLAADKLQPEKAPQVENTPPAVTRQSTKAQSTSSVSAQAGTGDNVKNHKVRAGDTLGKIAAKTRPEGVSLDQMLVALLNANKAAFDGGNINRLKAGKILAIPDAEVINQITPGEAKKEVIAQAADFNSYRKRLALSASAQTEVSDSGQQVASGKITPKVEETTPAPSGTDKLEVSKSENAKGSSGDVKGNAAADSLARDKALKEAQSRTAELEQNLSKLKQLAELKNKAGADLQQQAQAEKSLPNAQATAAVPAAAVEQPTPSTDTLQSEAPANVPTPKVDVKKVKVPPVVAEPEPGFLEENSMLVLGGGGILALVLGWMGFSAWKRKKESSALSELDDAHSTSNFSTQSAFGPSIDPTASSSVSSTTGGSSASQFSINVKGDAEPSVDALSQADTFLAFGRTEQAEDVLNSALETQPNRHDLYLKLLGIYAEQDKLAEYESLAKRFREQTLEDGPDWETARVMGAAIDPQNALYQLPSAGHELSEDVTKSVGVVALAGAAAAAVQAVVPEAGVESALPVQDLQAIDTETLDFDLDFDLDEAASSGAKVDPVAPTALAASPEMSALDFDLELSLPEAPSAKVLDTVTAHDAPLDMPLTEEAGNSIDFDFDLPLAGASPVVTNAPDLKLEAIDLDLDADLPAPTFGVIENEGTTDNPEVATKLELAAAYEEMGDNSGASELYQEALVEGSKSQQEFARAKLTSLN